MRERKGERERESRKKETRGRKSREFLRHDRHFFLPLQTDAEADGGELTEDGRRRNEKD